MLAFGFGGVKFADVLQCFECNGTGVGLMQIEEFAACVRPTAEFGAVADEGEQRFVTGVVVDNEMTLPTVEEVSRMFATTAGLVVEYDDARPQLKIIAAIRPQVGALRFSGVGVAPFERTHYVLFKGEEI